MYKIKTLNNGLRLVYENIPYVRSVSVGAWVGSGSRFEDEKTNGTAHFLEHMLFKGTKKRSALDIAEEMDSIGGQLNAFTTREYTCYYTHTIDNNLETSIDLLSDMLLNSKLSASDIDIEKKVIIEEINMYDDTPEELVYDILERGAWDKNPLGFNIAGTAKTVSGLDRDILIAQHEKFYVPKNMVISVSGNFDENELIKLIENYFGHQASQNSVEMKFSGVTFNGGRQIVKKDIEQAHIVMGFEGIAMESKDKYTLSVFNIIFGGGMSSRLFQKIREEKGLAYNVYSSPDSYIGAGMFTIGAGLSPDKLSEVEGLMQEEIDELLKNGITNKELIKGREQIKGSYILSLENVNNRMSALGKSLLLKNNILEPDEIIGRIDNVNLQDIEGLIKKLFLNKPNFTAIVSG